MRIATVVLPVPGLPVKHMCSDGGAPVQAERRARLRHQQVRGDVADARLDGREADELAVERHRVTSRTSPRAAAPARSTVAVRRS